MRSGTPEAVLARSQKWHSHACLERRPRAFAQSKPRYPLCHTLLRSREGGHCCRAHLWEIGTEQLHGANEGADDANKVLMQDSELSMRMMGLHLWVVGVKQLHGANEGADDAGKAHGAEHLPGQALRLRALPAARRLGRAR